MKDAIKRRSRFAKPQPQRTEIQITDADILLFEALYRHGQLPAPYLYEFTKHLRKDYRFHIRRLTDFRNGVCLDVEHRLHGFENLTHTCKPICYLARHPQQYMNFRARYQPGVYMLTPESTALLEGERHKISRSGSFVHDLFLGCFTASAELTLPFVFRDSILKTAPVKSFVFDKLEPDDLFGVKLDEGKHRFFALEIDRGTEPIISKQPRSSSISQKIQAYERAFAGDEFKTSLGVPNVSVLIATTNEARAANILNLVSQSSHAHKFYIKAFSDFGEMWRVPTELLKVIDGWKGVKGSYELNRKAPTRGAL